MARRPKSFSERRQQRIRKATESPKRSMSSDFSANKYLFKGDEMKFRAEFYELIDTPFGEIKTIEADLFFSIKDFDLRNEVLEFEGEIDEETTPEDELAFFKSAARRYPNEPLMYYELARAYFDADKIEKSKAQIIENYKRFKGFPAIDATYMDSLEEKEKLRFFEEELGGNLFLSDIYPSKAYFDQREVKLFYAALISLFAENKDYEKAEKCIQVLDEIGESDLTETLRMQIKWQQEPWKKYWLITKIILSIVALIAVVGWIIWGIISLIRWIF